LIALAAFELDLLFLLVLEGFSFVALFSFVADGFKSIICLTRSTPNSCLFSASTSAVARLTCCEKIPFAPLRPLPKRPITATLPVLGFNFKVAE
jgi:hypothetical protein